MATSASPVGSPSSQEALKLYQDLVETSQDLIWQCDAEGRYTYLNPAWETTFGYMVEEMLGRKFSDFQAPEFARRDLQEFSRLMQGGMIRGYETVHLGKAGQPIHLVFNAKCIRDERGGITGTRGTAYDISERKWAEETLKNTLYLLEATIESTDNGILVVNPEGRVIKANRKFADLWRIPDEVLATGQDEKLLNHILNQLTDPEAFLARVQALYGEPRAESFDLLHFKDGHVFERLSKPMFIDGEPRGRVWAFLDVTEQRKLQETANKNQKLEALGLLAGGIAHDFNNLLGGIYGFIELAGDATGEPQVQDHLDNALGTIDRARGLTQQLLTFAKGGVPLKKTGPLFPFISETAKFALSGANVSCRQEVPGDLWLCDFDRNQIGQVIDNLIINAQQAMPMGGTIAVRAANLVLREKENSSLPAGNYVKISIQDAGIGIPREILPRIFDPFFTTKTRGHGLGLATCHSIIHRHGGEIEVESEPGRGTTFHLVLPALPGALSSAQAAAQISHRGSGTFVVMDDEEVIRKTLGAVLKVLGYTPVLCKEGREALDFLREEQLAGRPITAMILDLTIPNGMGGRETIVEIRKLSREIPVFVASGYGEDPIMARPADFGFTASIRKPFRKAELAEMLERWVAGA